MDVALEFIANYAGSEMAGKVQLILEYLPPQIAYFEEVSPAWRAIPLFFFTLPCTFQEDVKHLPPFFAEPNNEGKVEEEELPEYIREKYAPRY